MEKAASPHITSNAGNGFSFIQWSSLKQPGQKTSGKAPARSKRCHMPAISRQPAGRQERMSMSVPVVVDQASCLYDLFLILRHISDI